MSIRFDWQAGDDNGEWETIAQTTRRRLPNWVRRALWLLAILLVGGTALAYGVLRLRYERACRTARAQVVEIMDLEARLFAAGDVLRFLAQQDTASPLWYERQAECTVPPRLPSACQDSPYPWLCPEQSTRDLHQLGLTPALCAPQQPIHIHDLELYGDVAWVQTLEGEPAVQRVRFYRRTELGWKHTAPRLDFWHDAVLERHGSVVVRYHERDRPYVEPALTRIAAVAADVSDMLGFAGPVKHIYVDWSSEFPLVKGRPSGPSIALPSPWLTGLPGEEGWDPAYLEQLTYRLVYEMAVAAVHSTSSPGPSPLQQAIAVEFTDWYMQRDLVQAPLLGRVIARHGVDRMPLVFLSLRGTNNTALFLIRWLSVHPNQAAFFELLLNVEREALLSGQKRSFMLFQDESWSASQSRYFDACRSAPCPTAAPIQVRDVQFMGDYARIELDEPLITLPGFQPQSAGLFVYYHQNEWDWRRVAAMPTATGT